jgi:hypothetical protein
VSAVNVLFHVPQVFPGMHIPCPLFSNLSRHCISFGAFRSVFLCLLRPLFVGLGKSAWRRRHVIVCVMRAFLCFCMCICMCVRIGVSAGVLCVFACLVLGGEQECPWREQVGTSGGRRGSNTSLDTVLQFGTAGTACCTGACCCVLETFLREGGFAFCSCLEPYFLQTSALGLNGPPHPPMGAQRVLWGWDLR